MEKQLAVVAILWVLSTLYFVYHAVKDGYPAYFGLVTSTAISGVALLLNYLVSVVAK